MKFKKITIKHIELFISAFLFLVYIVVLLFYPQTYISKSNENQGGVSNKVELSSMKITEKDMPVDVTTAPVVYTGYIKFPLKDYYKMTSPFGFRIHPITGLLDFHKGVDISADEGTPIMAVETGVVDKVVEAETGYGHYVMLKHSDGFYSMYAHCSKILVKEGMKIRQGEVIAKVGTTGNSTGNHLHLGLIKDGKYFDPEYLFKEELNVNNQT